MPVKIASSLIVFEVWTVAFYSDLFVNWMAGRTRFPLVGNVPTAWLVARSAGYTAAGVGQCFVLMQTAGMLGRAADVAYRQFLHIG